MSRIKLVLFALVVAGLSLGIAACGDDEGSDSSGGGGGETTLDLKIGDIIPLTGDLADFGPPGQKAADLAVDQINKAIDEVGADHTVTISHEDDQTTDSAGVSAARKLVGDGASCLAGSWASSVSIPLENGRLALGGHQAVFLAEFDGPRERTLLLTVTR